MKHLIDEILKRLRPALKSKAKAMKILERYWKGKIAIVWTVKDVHRAANERDLALTKEEAQEILTALHQKHNPQHGIKWANIYDQIDQKCVGRKLTKPELRRLLNKDIVTVDSVR